MANELRVRSNFLGGQLTADLVDEAGPSTMTSDALAALPAVGSTQHMAITMDPDGLDGAPEVIWVSAHTASATTATVLRAQEGTTRRLHRTDTYWTHGPTARDFDGDSTWTTISTFANSWVDNGAATYAVASYRKLATGMVIFRGFVKNGTAEATMFTMPVGYRPSKIQRFIVNSAAGASQVNVQDDGAVVQTNYFSGGSNVSLGLSPIIYLAEA